MLTLIAPGGRGTTATQAIHGISVLESAGVATQQLGAGLLFDAGLVELRQLDDHSAVVISPASERQSGDAAAPEEADVCTVLPLGRQHVLWSAIPALKAQFACSPQPASPIKVAAVVIVVDDAGSVLLTRRAATMRSYPGCWVLPGGAVDAGEDLAGAAAREVAEETGLVVHAPGMRPLAAWESAFPLSVEGYAAAKGLKAHVLMVAFAARVRGIAPAVTANPTEVDSACWVARQDVASLLDGSLTTEHADCCAASSGATSIIIAPGQLTGVYPNTMRPAPEGLGLAHHFTLTCWCQEGSPAAAPPPLSS
jgi:8-oxo-dGTP pyrophosphatase MutT (NUDIX family)